VKRVKSEIEVRWLRDALKDILDKWESLRDARGLDKVKKRRFVYARGDMIVAVEMDYYSALVYVLDDKQTIRLDIDSDFECDINDAETALDLLDFLLGEGGEDVDFLRVVKKIVDEIVQEAGKK
jgi:hypothetical protein